MRRSTVSMKIDWLRRIRNGETIYGIAKTDKVSYARVKRALFEAMVWEATLEELAE